MKEIIQAIITRLNQVPSLKEVRIYNNQFSKLEKEEAFLYPAALVEVATIDYITLPQRNQAATLTIRIHIVGESITQGSNDDFTIYEVKEEVNQYLYGFTGDLFSPLERTHEETDSNHDAIYIYKMEYSTRFREEIAKINPKTVEIKEITVAYDLDIDNTVIRTGDNANYVFGPGANI